ncbi:MAG TPA: hydrogenase maturation protease [Gammaproteobacteria bacterium]|nr:hydrogenase maturation protease [Gammaproteobacteria bacterium]
MTRTVILGIGNTLLGDDGAGIHALRALEARCDDANVQFVDGGTLSFPLTEALGDAGRLIVIDAAQLDAPPGTVRVFENGAMDAYVARGPCGSVHEVSLAELLDMVRLLGRLPEPRALIGIQPAVVDWSETPTPAVAAAIPQACARAQQLLAAWS